MNTILVIEDDQDIRETLVDLLSMHKYKVIAATDGAQGLGMAMSVRPDLVISDVNMPGLDGFQLAEFLQQHTQLKHIPIIFLTARSQTQDFRQGLKLGAVDYLVKPFKLDELLQSVHKQLDRLNQNKVLQDSAFRLFLENPFTGVFFFSQEHFEMMNPRLTEITGYSLAELNALAPEKLVVGYTDMLLQQFAACYSGADESLRVRLMILTKNRQAKELEVFVKHLVRNQRNYLLGNVIEIQQDAHPSGVEAASVQQIIQYLHDTNREQLAQELATTEKILGFEQENERQALIDRIGLTDREREVLALICEGLTNAEIATKLFLSPRTVDNHRANILSKTGTNNTAKLVAYTIRHKLIE